MWLVQFYAKRGFSRFVFSLTLKQSTVLAAAAEAFACVEVLVYLFVQILLFLLGFCM